MKEKTSELGLEAKSHGGQPLPDPVECSKGKLHLRVLSTQRKGAGFLYFHTFQA